MSSTPEPARPAPDSTTDHGARRDRASTVWRAVTRPVVRAPVALTPGPYVPSAAGDSILAQVAADLDGQFDFLLTQHSATELLQKVAEAARAHVPGVAEASVTLLHHGSVSSVAWTGLLAYELDEAQYESGFGPCMDAARTGVARWVRNSRDDRRWPVYLWTAVRCGALSSFSVPLPLSAADGVRAGLNLYATDVDGFSDAAREAAVRLARRAATVVDNRAVYDSVVGEVEHLRTAMEGRAVIDQAKGVLMFAFGLSDEAAFEALSRRSQNTNVKVQELAVRMLAAVAAGQGEAAVNEMRPRVGQTPPTRSPEGPTGAIAG